MPNSVSSSLSLLYQKFTGARKLLDSDSLAVQQQPFDPNAPKVVILAVSIGDGSENAFNWYFENLHRDGNRLVFVHVIELPDLKNQSARNLHMSPGVLANMWQTEEDKTKELEIRMKALLKERKCNGILRTVAGKPGEMICAVAREERATMIVTSSRSQGKFRRAFLGSTSDYLVHHAHCPVVVCRLDTLNSAQSATLSSSQQAMEEHMGKRSAGSKMQPQLPPTQDENE
ncbi:unnamed protein product [Dimorphilus gyrociliatus]|uniref:UspA domain-containing protein n=1 Tax=Dimorphilus gyrociliatus TaxID=2664684 RepID=A0A7I8VTM7_9ANNE|nr:unnamed protein product [Dimorphilus gyrociliatus]